ncbi:hypothetical protein GCM10017782_16060 [Deinococcus ficus]|nr:hypothetical protein GCM10017782_16060 [Deinococcus ficus]
MDSMVPAASVTGQWSGDVSHWALGSYEVTATLSQVDTPRVGDFKGTVSAAGIGLQGKITGNVKDGTLIASDGTTIVNCAGQFLANSRYEGDCSARGQDVHLRLFLKQP